MQNKIIAIGSHLPQKILTNHDLSQMVDTNHEWIIERTGIQQRHISNEQETTSFLAYHAALKALEKAKLTANEIDIIIVATTTPDLSIPSTACLVQKMLGAKNAFAFDIAAACSGFVYGLSLVDSLLKHNMGQKALLIGAETFTRFIDWSDRGTCILFGDGAGAAIIERKDKEQGIIASKLYSDGSLAELLATDGGISKNKQAGIFAMQGKEVFKHATSKMSQVVSDILAENGFGIADVDWIIPHQANQRIIEATGKKLNIDANKVISSVAIHANTSAASIPLALDYAQDKFKQGDLMVLVGLGAGITWGANLLRW